MKLLITLIILCYYHQSAAQHFELKIPILNVNSNSYSKHYNEEYTKTNNTIIDTDFYFYDKKYIESNKRLNCMVSFVDSKNRIYETGMNYLRSINNYNFDAQVTGNYFPHEFRNRNIVEFNKMFRFFLGYKKRFKIDEFYVDLGLITPISVFNKRSHYTNTDVFYDSVTLFTYGENLYPRMFEFGLVSSLHLNRNLCKQKIFLNYDILFGFNYFKISGPEEVLYYYNSPLKNVNLHKNYFNNEQGFNTSFQTYMSVSYRFKDVKIFSKKVSPNTH